jgi:hypothetical protein
MVDGEGNGKERAFTVGEGEKCREYAGTMQLDGASKHSIETPVTRE